VFLGGGTHLSRNWRWGTAFLRVLHHCRAYLCLNVFHFSLVIILLGDRQKGLNNLLCHAGIPYLESKVRYSACHSTTIVLHSIDVVVVQDQNCLWSRRRNQTAQSSSMPWVIAALLGMWTKTKLTKHWKYVSCYCYGFLWLAVWCCGNIIRRMNKVTLHWAQLVLQWVDHLQPPLYVTKQTRSTQPCIPLGLLNWVPALIGSGKSRNITSAWWQVTLCDPIWHVSSCSGEACSQTSIPGYFT